MKLFGTLSSLPEPLCSQSTSDWNNQESMH
jgi:hypothetical protein